MVLTAPCGVSHFVATCRDTDNKTRYARGIEDQSTVVQDYVAVFGRRCVIAGASSDEPLDHVVRARLYRW